MVSISYNKSEKKYIVSHKGRKIKFQYWSSAMNTVKALIK